MRYLSLLLVICVVGFANETSAQQRPEALERLEAYRAALRTGHVEWSVVNHTAKSYAHETRFKTSRFGGNELLAIDHGDENGVVLRTTDGRPSEVAGFAPHCTLYADGRLWMRWDKPLGRTHLFPRGWLPDVRTLGVSCGLGGGDIHDCLWRDSSANPVAWKFEESAADGLQVVRVRKADATTTYWLDPRRGWSPVRVRNEHDKYGWRESRCALKDFDGVWFPQTVEIFSGRYEDGREPEKIVRVYSATFNRPEQPQRLTPADIGVEVGSDVVVYDEQMRQTIGKWDGEQVLSFDEFAKRLRRGEVTEGPNLTRAHMKAQARLAKEARAAAARGEGDVAAVWTGPMTVEQARKALLLTPKELESLWEAYTRHFIKEYEFNEEQTQKALSILKGCQEQGNAHVNKHKSDLERLDERAKALTELKGEERAKAEAQIKRDRQKLLKPLDDIFEQQLKPRLDRIPTRAQRKAAEERKPAEERIAPTTKPAGESAGKD